MTSYLTSSKTPFTDKDGHLTKVFQKEKTGHCKSIAERICEQKLESSLIKSLPRKNDTFGSVW